MGRGAERGEKEGEQLKYGPDFKDLRLHCSRAEKRSFMSLKLENCSWILEKTSIREADMHAVRVAVWIAYSSFQLLPQSHSRVQDQ